jgi:hypothetical protein
MMAKHNEPRKHASKVLNGEKLNSVLTFIDTVMGSNFKVTSSMFNMARISISQN